MLKIWIPGTDGTTKNQGLLQLPSASYSSVSSSNDGKLGKAIYGQICYHLSSDPCPSNWTISCWVKFSSGYAQYNNIILCANTSDSEDSKFYLSIVNNTTLNIGRGSSSSLGYTLSGNFQVGTWYHLAATYNGTTTTLYLNGSSVNSGSVGSTKSALNYTIGGRSANTNGTSTTSGASFPVNDVRIYDHCLTASEVKEISKGLVAHYTLGSSDAGFSIAAKYQLVPPLNKTETTSGNVTYSNNGYVINVSGSVTNTSTYLQWTDNTQFIAGHKYYFRYVGDSSITSKSNFGTSGYSNWTGSPHSGTKVATCNTTYSNKFCITFGSGTSGTVSGTVYCSCYDLTAMFGSGNEPTASTVDVLFPFKFCPINSNLPVYDSSGYSRNLTINGTVYPVASSARYNQSLKFNGSSYLSCTSPTAEAKTLSLWAYIGSSIPTYNILFADYKSKLSLGFYNSGSTLITSCSGSSRTIGSTSAIKLNSWNHFCVVNGSTNQLYINGSAVTMSSSNYWNHNLDVLMIGKRADANDGFTDKISDVRLYATALSADDVKDLYNLGALIS